MRVLLSCKCIVPARLVVGEALGDPPTHRPGPLTESCHEFECARAQGIKLLGLSGNPVGDGGAKAIAAAAAASTQELAVASRSVDTSHNARIHAAWASKLPGAWSS